MQQKQTAIVTGAAQGIGFAVVTAFLGRGYNVVANSRSFARSELTPAANLALVEGDVGAAETAHRIVSAAMSQFGSIDHVINNAGTFFSKPFVDYSMEDFHRLVSTNLDGFIFVTQAAVRQMLHQGRGGSVTSISAALADNPISGAPASVPMITKGGLNTITRSLAMEYAKQGIRFNAVAPGVVDTPLHAQRPREFLVARSPMGVISAPQEIADAVVFLAEAPSITGEILHVDGGAHSGKW
ncbi:MULTISPECIES: SDR family oxidoreductase [Acidobacterium]|uniref:Oxidoreductase, short chain dehydrogenase/reductase family n=1 Tax=Acidobacterium capsulatum (strain ATCC 51196 / DSM 11244 / BCRC 80197 / JCM 7670 / NBRC 15755 / NCIMB 13165 / 161) TaxID=240015 RepID=C1F0U8_ACIC5|nr:MULTISPECIES: SDR family oxidoreductase [Acidobacterium]ACO31536.1 oxidoreductase, short chain dehydrogenase/reductase family [Acidobacterium capsulatum ATCC 51196]HCT62013.1 SDR family NAD(P)-dependent oxidoreductase [Acidobacterium sp.]